MSAGRVGPHRPDVLASEIDGRVQLFVPGRAEALVLNDTATAVWRLADGSRDLDQLVAELAARYELAAELIRDDVRQTVQTLADHQAIQAP